MSRNENSLGAKILSCVMSLVLVVGLMPLPAFAEAGDVSVAVESQLATGVVSGDNAPTGESSTSTDLFAAGSALGGSRLTMAADSEPTPVEYVERHWDDAQKKVVAEKNAHR